MKTTILLLLAALSGILYAQGPLAPPAGPAPTMKSLDQVEPRTPISSLPYTISESGSYYFTGNLHFEEDSLSTAIRISAGGHVKLDLMGLTLSSSGAVSGDGITISNLHVGSVTVCNGSIEGKSTVALSGDPVTWTVNAAGFTTGINGASSKNASFKDLSISGTRLTGLFSGANAKIMNVSCRNNGGSGIFANEGSVTSCTAFQNGATGIFAINGSVTNSTASENGDTGITAVLGTVTSCNTHSNGATGISAYRGSVTSCTVSQNGGIGIIATEGSVTNSTASENGDKGITAVLGTVTSCNTHSNGATGISAYRGSVTSCTASENGGVGIYGTEGSVTNCAASSNTGYDISASNAVVAYCRFTTFATAGSTRTGNFPSP
jgi:hypothetical protein